LALNSCGAGGKGLFRAGQATPDSAGEEIVLGFRCLVLSFSRMCKQVPEAQVSLLHTLSGFLGCKLHLDAVALFWKTSSLFLQKPAFLIELFSRPKS
jgi:hypothetical protein